MEVCGQCGRPRKGTAQFCTGCGSRFADHDASSGPPIASRRRRPLLTGPVLAVAAIVVLGGVGTGAYLLVRHASAPKAAARGAVTRSIGRTRAGAIPTQSTFSPPPSPSAGIVATGPVTVGPAAGQDPSAQQVATFLGQYFDAINSHDYQAYDALLTQREQISGTQFQRGYRSTADSREVLTAVGSDASGRTVATVSFVSHQDPADSVDKTQSCTDWNISFYLVQSGASYLIDTPPPSYHASDEPCQ